jgi:hypothetical protein
VEFLNENSVLRRERFLKEMQCDESNKINAISLALYRAQHGRIDNLSTAVKQ